MAKVKPGYVSITGKMGDNVITSRGRYDSYMRKVVKPGTKKNEKALKEQYSRTATLNQLAASVNTVMKGLAGNFKNSRFYVKVQGRFRKESSNNRLLLLRRLKGLEIHPVYPLGRYVLPATRLTSQKNEVRVSLLVTDHPMYRDSRANCYYYQVSLITWNNKEQEADCTKKYSDWIWMTEGKPGFDFLFEKPTGAVHWMLCLRIRIGVNKNPVDLFEAEGMQIVDTGSFDKREQAWLEELAAKSATEQRDERNEPEVIDRVKATNFW